MLKEERNLLFFRIISIFIIEKLCLKVMYSKEQKQIIKNIKRSIQNVDGFNNIPETIEFNNEQYSQNNRKACPFVFLKVFGANKVIYGNNGEAHSGCLDGKAVNWLFKTYNFDDIMDVAESTSSEVINDELEYRGATYDDFYNNPSKYIKLGRLFNWTDTNVMLCGRYFVIEVPEINQTFTIFAFWDRRDVDSVQQAINTIVKEKGLSNTQIYVANGYYEMIPFNSFTPLDLQSSDDDKKFQIMHLMKSKDKQEATSDFRNTRDKLLGRKLMNQKIGQEMPMAQYNALRRVEESKELLQEINVLDKFNLETKNGKTDLDFNTYWGICAIDPTFTNHNVGKYGNWLLQHVTPEMVNNDEMNNKIYNALKLFNVAAQMGVLKRNGVSNDIGSFKTVDELINTLENLQEQGALFSQRESNGMEKLKGQYKIVSETQNWYVVEPLTFDAEQFFGGGTRWCTVAKEFTFRDYRNNSTLYIAIPKGDLDSKKRMQFQFPEDGSDSDGDYADVYDEVFHNPKKCIYHIIGNKGAEYQELCRLWSNVSSDEITFSPSFDSFNLVFADEVPELLKQGVSFEKIFDDYWGESQTVDGVMLDGKFNFVNINTRELASDVWVDYVNDAGYVECGGLCNYINYKTGKYIWDKPYDEWFDMGDDEWNDNGEVHVLLRGKDYWLNEQGKLRQCKKSGLNESNSGGLITESTRDNLLLPYLNILQQKGQNVTLGELKVFLMRKFVTEANIHALSQNSNYYLAGVARYYFNGDLTVNKQLNVFYPRVTDKFIPEICNRLDEIIIYLRNAYIDNHGNSFEQPEDFGTLSIAQLFKKYGGKIDKLKQKYAVLDKTNTAEEKPINTAVSKNYTFDIMYCHEDCKKYNEATSPGAWCITYGQQHYNAYTKRNSAHFVIFVKNGYENIPRKVGQGFPLDEYGLSLIAVQQSNVDGHFVCATTRWNHGGYGGAPNVPNADYALTYEQLKQVTGVSDEKFQEIFNIWKERGGDEKVKDRLANQREKIDIIRKFKYAEILLRNGSTFEQLHQDNRLSSAKLLYPSNITPENVKVNKSVIALCIRENDKSYWTIMDRGVVKPDEILCNEEIFTGNYNAKSFGWEHEHGNEFALCWKNNKTMFYIYKLHSLLDVDGNKFWHKVSDLTDNLSMIKVQTGTSYKSHEPFILWDWSKNQPIVLPNGRSISEEVTFDDLATSKQIPIIYIIGDSAAKEYYFFDIETGKFMEELNGFVLYGVREAQGLFVLVNPNDESLDGNSQYYSPSWIPKQLYDYNQRKFVQLMGDDTPIYDVEKVMYYYTTINADVRKFLDEFIILTVGRNPEAKKVIYNYTAKEPLKYPNGEVVYFKNETVKPEFNLLVLALPSKDYSWDNSVMYNLKEKKFYKNEDGSLVFKYYGQNIVYDKYGTTRALPESTDGPYWYEEQKVKIEDVEKLLKEGVAPENIFDSIHSNSEGYENYEIVILNKMFNIYLRDKNELLLNHWVHLIYPYHCNRALIEENTKSTSDNACNYITPDGSYLLQENIAEGNNFDEESQRAVVRRHRYGGYNLIDVNGKRMSLNDFKSIGDFHKDTLCYDALSFNTRKTRYLSIYGHLFNNEEEAYQDSLHGEPQIDEYYRKHPEVAEYAKQRQLYESKNFDAAARTHYKVSGESLDKYAHVVDDVIEEVREDDFNKQSVRTLTRESLDELCSASELNDVMSSFDIQQRLNDKFWDEEKHLNPRIRMRLLDIADKFYNSMEVQWAKPSDVIMTGSLCNYNWSKYSDVDLHIVMDFTEVDERVNFVKDYFDSKKKLWNEAHEDLSIYGYPVEVYVQDENEEHTASGVYSLYRDKWIVEPSSDNFKNVDLDREMIVNKVKSCAEKIEDLEDEYNQETDTQHIETISKKVKKLFDKIKGIRKTSLAKSGEMGSGNIWFKSLRRLGYIERLIDLKSKTFDKINSIK